jgi:hypothetical protein
MTDNRVYFDDQAARALRTMPLEDVVLSPYRRIISVTQQIQIDLQTEDQLLTALQVFSLSIPVEASPFPKLTGYLTTIRGHVLKNAGARVMFLAD